MFIIQLYFKLYTVYLYYISVLYQSNVQQAEFDVWKGTLEEFEGT